MNVVIDLEGLLCSVGLSAIALGSGSGAVVVSSSPVIAGFVFVGILAEPQTNGVTVALYTR